MGVTPIIKQQDYPYPEVSAITLAGYAQHIKSCECTFFGIGQAVPDTKCIHAECRTVWTKKQRDWVQYYLAEAQWEIENVLNYFVGKRWVTDERHRMKTPISTRWKYIVSGGVKTEVDVALAEVVNTGTDPGTVGPIAVAFTDTAEVQIYHAGTDYPITPSSITITGGSLTIELPRCRTVLPEKQDNDSSGLTYTALSNFASSVDIKRVYNVDDNPVTVVRRLCSNCAETTEGTCMYVRYSTEGTIDYKPCTCRGNYVLLNYYAGRPMIENGRYTRFGRQAQDAIIHLMHVKMPQEPCECDNVNELWKRDREVAVDGQGRYIKGNNPFGIEEGAWIAWGFVNGPGMKVWKPGLL